MLPGLFNLKRNRLILIILSIGYIVLLLTGRIGYLVSNVTSAKYIVGESINLFIATVIVAILVALLIIKSKVFVKFLLLMLLIYFLASNIINFGNTISYGDFTCGIGITIFSFEILNSLLLAFAALFFGLTYFSKRMRTQLFTLSCLFSVILFTAVIFILKTIQSNQWYEIIEASSSLFLSAALPFAYLIYDSLVEKE